MNKDQSVVTLGSNECVTHGECLITAVAAIPGTAKRVKPSNGTFHIVAPSETTGNHHCVDTMEGVEVYQDGEKWYVNAEKPTKVFCVVADRHDAISLAPGKYEFGSQQEFDPFTARLNKVRD